MERGRAAGALEFWERWMGQRDTCMGGLGREQPRGGGPGSVWGEPRRILGFLCVQGTHRRGWEQLSPATLAGLVHPLCSCLSISRVPHAGRQSRVLLSEGGRLGLLNSRNTWLRAAHARVCK